MAMAGSPSVVIVYGTVLYDHAQLLAGVRSVVGADVTVVGCSTQGVSRPGGVDEVERVVGVAVLSGVSARAAVVESIADDPRQAGLRLAEALGPQRGSCPMLLWYDPLTGVDVDEMLEGLAAGGRPLVLGGAAGQAWGPMHRTYQFVDDRVMSGAAVGLHLEGVEILFDQTHGAESLGLEMTVTRSEGNVLQEIDGQPALSVWTDQLGAGRSNDVDELAAWPLGVALPEEEASHYEGLISRAVFGLRHDTKEIVLQAPIPAGTRIHLCHRTQEAVFDGALAMARRLAARLEGVTPLLALPFECAARPRPFLGEEASGREVRQMQEILGREVPWLGHFAWGELAPIGGRTWFHNYTFPLAVFVPG
ncbi:MAG: FIST C-terminal domain-containing protein [Myxococcales bacterium]|nr:FIST C-terminal domain-containing protein [Myxococcales bacterium]